MGRKRKYASGLDRIRAYRARRKAEALHRLDAPTPPVVAVVDHADPVGALAEWSRTTLIVPPGHPLAGGPMELAEYAVGWLRLERARIGAQHGSEEREECDRRRSGTRSAICEATA